MNQAARPAAGPLAHRPAVRLGLQSVIALVLSALLLHSSRAAPPASAERELIRDPHFQRGFVLLEPAPGKRVPCGVLPPVVAGEKPVWDLAQWSSKFPLSAESHQRLPQEAMRFANSAKAVTVGKPGTNPADVSFAVMASVEYGTRARKDGEPWVHLLAQQDIVNPPSFAELGKAWFHIEAKLKSARKIDTPDYSPSRHAAQFQVFFSVQNLNRASSGYGHYLWFGIPLYDDRSRFPAAHKAQDTGGTSMFIFTPAGDVYTAQSAHDRDWIAIDKDLLPLLREGLATAWRRGFLKESQKLADYRIAGMNLGWELPGIFDVEMQVRNLSLKVSPPSPP